MFEILPNNTDVMRSSDRDLARVDLSLASQPKRALEIWGALDELNKLIEQSGYQGEPIEIRGTRYTHTSNFETHQRLIGTTETQKFLAITEQGLKITERVIDHTPMQGGDGAIPVQRGVEFFSPNLISCFRLASNFDVSSLRRAVEQTLAAKS